MTMREACRHMLRRITLGFHRDERGATLTEFAITLPIWIVMMGGLINLGKIGHDTTANHLETQKALWDSVMEASTGKDEAHMFPAVAGAAAAAESAELAADSDNPHQVTSGVNGVVMGTGLAVNGSWGESYERAIIFKAVPGTDVPDLHYMADDVLEKGSSFPLNIVNDGAANTDWKNGGGGLYGKVISYAGDALAGSGAIAALGAGNRYGEVYAATPDQPIDLAFGRQITVSSHANLLVAPSPLTGNEARFAPFILARLVAEGEENYNVMMNFGESEWDNSGNYSRDTPDNPEDDINDQSDDDIDDKKKKKEKCEGENPPSDCDDFCASIPGGCDPPDTEDP